MAVLTVTDAPTDGVWVGTVTITDESTGVVTTLQNGTVAVSQQVTGLQGPAGPPAPIPYFAAGALTVRQGTSRFRFPAAATIIGVSAAINTPAVGADIAIDVNVNGASILGGTPFTIAAGAYEAAERVLNAAVNTGDYATVDIDAVGTTTPGSNLTILVRYTV